MDVRNEERNISIKSQKLTGWKANTFDRDVFAACLEDIEVNGTAEDMAKQLINHVTIACDASMIRRKRSSNKSPVYWWNNDIAILRTECLRARREHTRTRGRQENILHQRTYREKKRALKKAIRKSKRASFTEICDELEQNPWGLAYKLVTKKLKCLGPTPPIEELVLDKIVEHLFPNQETTTWQNSVSTEIYSSPPVTDIELEGAVSKFKDKKSPGLDCISNRVLKEAIKLRPEQFIKVFNTCLTRGVFPTKWKRQKLVLLNKNKGPPDDPSSYRPLCMIDTCGKLLESIVCKRLENCVNAKDGLSNNQYGFRKAKSTMDAIKVVTETAAQAIEGRSWKRGGKEYCVVVTLDVKNAFNTANWEHIMSALTRLDIPAYLVAIIQDYFRNRELVYETDKGSKSHKITGGVPQGSVLGPLLWNIMYDGVLRLHLPERAKIIGYADDLALVCVAKELSEVETVVNASIHITRSWLITMGLALAAHKTESVLISSRATSESINIKIGTCSMETAKSLKYLGVIIDTRLSYKEHLRYIRNKASKTCQALSRIMPNTRGPKYLQRKLLANVVTSVILYASPIWAHSLRYPSYVKLISPVYRLAALRVCSAFRTVSDEAALVIAGMIPIDLLAMMRSDHENCIANWQARWSSVNNGRWTHSLIPDIRIWLNRRHGELDFYITQLLTGHGCFRAYLYRFGHDSDPYCPSCSGNVLEDARHVFFTCPRFQGVRANLERTVGHRIGPTNIIPTMLISVSYWTRVCEYAKLVLLELRRLELRRRSYMI